MNTSDREGSERRGSGPTGVRCSILTAVDGPGIVEWVAIALSFVAVIVILRYARQPRCELCSRRHAQPELAPPATEAGVGPAELPEATQWGAISWTAE